MIEAWRAAATKPARGVGSVAALLTLALGCVVGSPAWSACPPGQSNCQSSEPPREAPPQPRPQQFEAPRPPPVQPQFQTQPQVQQRPLQFEQPRQQQVQQPQQFQQPRQTVPAQTYRPNPTTGGPPASAGAAVRPGPSFAGSARVGGAPPRDTRAGSFAYHGRSYAPFRAGPYRWPGGMHYRRYGVGAFLPLAFILSGYVIADWMDYGLAQPMPGYEWVRYGPDLLLVDPNTGQVVDAAYGAFAEGDAGPPPDYTQAAPYPPAPGYGVPPPGYAAPPPQAAGPQTLGNYGNWVAASYQENGQPVCYAVTRAQASAPPIPNRGAPVLTVTERPGLRDAVSIGGVVANAPNGAITLQVDQAPLDVYPAGGNAFARDGAAAVAAFRSGIQAIVQSPSPYGGPVTDTFSLVGFSAAYAAINAACPG